MQRSIIRMGAGMASLLLLASFAYASEEEVPLESVPKPVMDAAKARFPNAAVTGAAIEMDGDKLAYEVSLKDDSQIIHMILSPAGEIALYEREIIAEDFAKTLEDRYPSATYKTLEQLFTVENQEEKLAYYEVRLETAKEEEVKLKLRPDGAIAAKKEADSEDDDAIAANEEADSEDDDASAGEDEEEEDSEDDDASAGEDEADSEDDDASADEEEED